MIKISKCCDSHAVGELGEVEDATFGKCSDCGDYTFFDTVDEARAESLEESNKTPHTFIEHGTSRDRLQIIGPKCGFPEGVITNFNPAIISWVAERLGITAEDGVDQALADGHFVINTANEIHNDAQIKMAVEPGSGTVLNTLNVISEVVTNVLTTTNQKVVFHCAMGMERSVLACIWFMASQWRMRTDKSYQQIKKNRPIALDRSDWITL
jgi:hypothetical protein